MEMSDFNWQHHKYARAEIYVPATYIFLISDDKKYYIKCFLINETIVYIEY